jgi:8-oxo-dGTP diphosphatase
MIERVALAVDVACFALAGGQLRLLLVRRAEEPFAGLWALPGGVVRADEPLDGAAARILAERTGVGDADPGGSAAGDPYLEQLYTFGQPGRDPRGRTVSVAYYALLPGGERPPVAGRGVGEAAWHPADQLPPLAFDHAWIAAYARWRLAQKVTYTPLAFQVLPEQFTLGDLRAVHEAIEGRSYDPSNFQRQMLARWELAPVPGARDRRTRRPARVYRYLGRREIAGPPAADARGKEAARREGPADDRRG